MCQKMTHYLGPDIIIDVWTTSSLGLIYTSKIVRRQLSWTLQATTSSAWSSPLNWRLSTVPFTDCSAVLSRRQRSLEPSQLISKATMLSRKIKKSPILKSALQVACEKLEIKFKLPTSPVQTRWNSIHLLIESLIPGERGGEPRHQ